MSQVTLFHDAAYIDPTDCDSQVSYKINLNEYKHDDGTVKKSINATVLLSDCSRRIDWYFGETDQSLEKIEKAIEMLSAFRRLLRQESRKLKKSGGK